MEEVGAGVGITRAETDGLGELGDGFIRATGFREHDAEIVVGLGIARGQSRGFPQMIQGEWQLAMVLVQITQIVVGEDGRGVFLERIQPQRLVVVEDLGMARRLSAEDSEDDHGREKLDWPLFHDGGEAGDDERNESHAGEIGEMIRHERVAEVVKMPPKPSTGDNASAYQPAPNANAFIHRWRRSVQHATAMTTTASQGNQAVTVFASMCQRG